MEELIMRTKKPSTTIIALAALSVPLWFGAPPAWAQDAQQPAGVAGERLGTIHFPVSCNDTAQQAFDRAMALYHSFHWREVKKGFDTVLEADPNCAMAYWGHALVLLDNPFIWPPKGKNLSEGRVMIDRALAGTPGTQREADYIAALESFYKDHEQVEHRTRAEAYVRAMGDLAERYPDDAEASILYALALSATFDPVDKTYARQLEAAAILEPLFERYPEHPGVAHYLIHSYDYPAIADRGLPAAKRYAQIAESAPHALHMPSHIFTRLGHWQDSIATNIASANASADLRGRLHAWDYLTYAYLQVAQDADAQAIVEEVAALREVKDESLGAAYGLAAIPMRAALERGRWEDAARMDLSPAEPDFAWQRFPNAEAVNAFGRGLGAARSGDTAGAREQLRRLETLRQAMIDARQAYWADQALIQSEMIEAWIVHTEGRSEEALQRLRAAADHEDATEKSVVTPGPLIPARELLGEMLMELARPGDALVEFEAVTVKEPNRFRALYGAARAAELSGDRDKARAHYTTLMTVAANPASGRSELATARAFLDS
jgi:hypothetical protein